MMLSVCSTFSQLVNLPIFTKFGMNLTPLEAAQPRTFYIVMFWVVTRGYQRFGGSCFLQIPSELECNQIILVA
jgi:hypothetical protein